MSSGFDRAITEIRRRADVEMSRAPGVAVPVAACSGIGPGVVTDVCRRVPDRPVPEDVGDLQVLDVLDDGREADRRAARRRGVSVARPG